jgi:hypothetical protein
MEMRAKGQHKEAEELEASYLILKSQSKEAAQGFADVSTGMINTEAAQKSFMATQGESMRASELVRAGEITAAEAAQRVAAAHGRTADSMGASLGKMGVYNETFGDLAADLRLKGMSGKDIEEQLKKVKQEQIDQGLKGGKAADGITDQYAKNIVQQQKLNEKMENVVFKGIDNALVITNKLGTATDSLATGFEVLGKAVNKLLNVLGLGQPERGATKEEDAANKKAEAAKAAFEESVKDAGFAAKTLGVGLTDSQKRLKEQYKEAEEAAKATKEHADAQYTVQKQIKHGEERRKLAAQAGAGKQELPAGVAPSTAGGGRGSVAPPVPTAPAGGGAAPATAAPTTAPPVRLTPQPLEGEVGNESSVKMEDVLKFTARSGSQQAFEGLDNNFKKAVIAAAEQYKAATGNPIQINSAKRDPADQERLYAETVKLGTPGIGPTGMKVAKPGRSLHERGHAVDVQQYKDPAAVAAFNAQGLFQKVPNDPVHFQARDGGVFDGPDTGYNNITLHGTEAVIPLKNGAVPVRLFGDETSKSAETTAPDVVLQNLLTELVGSAGAAPDTGAGQADISASLNNMQANMFASIQSLQASVMDSKFDIDLRRDIVEPGDAQETQMATNTAEQVVSEDNSAITQMLKDAKEANFAMLAMISELVREQRNANDISTRILQVSSN